jgi:hypothetical protein
MAHVPAALDRLESACKAATKREGVEAAVDAAREELRRVAAASWDGDATQVDPDAPARAVVTLADDERVGPEGLRRVAYVLHEASQAHPRQARVPRAADAEAEALRTWGQFLEARFGGGDTRGLSRVLVAPAGGEWVDLILGEPDPSHFRALRYSTNLVAPDTQTAYSLDDAFVRESDEFLARCRATTSAAATGADEATTIIAAPSGLGMTEVSADAAARPAGLGPALSPFPAPAPADEPPAPSTPIAARRLKHLTIWIVLGVLLVLAASVLVVIARIDPNAAGPTR